MLHSYYPRTDGRPTVGEPKMGKSGDVVGPIFADFLVGRRLFVKTLKLKVSLTDFVIHRLK